MSDHKIIISSYDDLENPYYGGGGAISVHEIAKRLSADYQITVVTGRYPGSTNKIVDGVSYIRAGSNVFGPKIGQLLFQLNLLYLLRTLKFDLWIESFTPPISTSFLPLFTSKKVIGLVHMLSGEDMRRKYFLPFDVIERFGLRYYQHLIATSAPLKSTLAQLNPTANIQVITNAVSDVCHPNSGLKDKTHLLFIGRLETNQKGIDLLLHSFSQIKPLFKYPLIIAGTGTPDEISKIKKIIHKLNLQNRVNLVGKVSGAQKRDLMEHALCLACSSRFETFSLSTLEAITSGIPVVTFAIDGLKWLPRDCALKTPKFDTQLFASNLVTASTDSIVRKNLISAGLKYSKNYSWEFSAKKYKTLIDKLLK